MRVLMFVAALMAVVAGAAFAAPMVEAPSEAERAALQADVDAAQEQLDAAAEALAAYDSIDSDHHLGVIEAAVQAMLNAIAVPWAELVAEHGAEAAAAMVADRLGLDAGAVASLLIPPAEEAVEAAEEAEEVAEEAAEAAEEAAEVAEEAEEDAEEAAEEDDGS